MYLQESYTGEKSSSRPASKFILGSSILDKVGPGGNGSESLKGVASSRHHGPGLLCKGLHENVLCSILDS